MQRMPGGRPRRITQYSLPQTLRSAHLEKGPAATRSHHHAGMGTATAKGLVLWGGTVSIGFSTVVLLAVLSRHFHHDGFARLSSLFGLFFVASLIPSGFPLRAAALAVDGAPPMRMTARGTALCVTVGAVVSPLIAYLLHLPVIAVLCVAAQVILAIPLSMRRGLLIAAHRFDAMGGNQFLESAFRIALGVVLGLAWGLSGTAAGLAIATAVALLAVPAKRLPRSALRVG